MNRENKQLVRAAIMEAAENLEGKLPESDKHPNGRNPYAHIPKVIKSMTGMSYTDLPDDKLGIALEIIAYCEKNPF